MINPLTFAINTVEPFSTRADISVYESCTFASILAWSITASCTWRYGVIFDIQDHISVELVNKTLIHGENTGQQEEYNYFSWNQ